MTLSPLDLPKVDVKIWNTSWQIRLNERLKVGVGSSAAFIEVASLKTGTYLASVTYLQSGRLTGRSNLPFVVIP